MPARADTVCARCHLEIFRESEFLQACRDAGLAVDEHGRVSLRVGPVTTTGLAAEREIAARQYAQRAKHDELDGRKGYRCTGCRAMYCSNCLYYDAPSHPRGGKACFSCGATFSPYIG